MLLYKLMNCGYDEGVEFVRLEIAGLQNYADRAKKVDSAGLDSD